MRLPASTPPLTPTAAGGRFSADIDGNVTIVVTGMAHAGEAMDAAVGKHDRYTLALRQKVNTDRPGCVL